MWTTKFVNRAVYIMVQGAAGFCLAVQPTDEAIATIGRKYYFICISWTHICYSAHLQVYFHALVPQNLEIPVMHEFSKNK